VAGKQAGEAGLLDIRDEIEQLVFWQDYYKKLSVSNDNHLTIGAFRNVFPHSQLLSVFA
jgi:hypothetical protein